MCRYFEKAASCQASGMGVLFFIQMSCYRTISLAPFCLISLCANLFILDSVMKMLIVAASFFSYVCAIALSLCFPSVYLQCSAHPHTLCLSVLSLWCDPCFWQLVLVCSTVSHPFLNYNMTRQWCSNCLCATVDLLFSSQVDVQTGSGILFACPVIFVVSLRW